MITVVTTYRTGPGATRGVDDLLARHAAASEQEAGCRQFLVHQIETMRAPLLIERECGFAGL
jgi:quinol monooxygenase YgiN